MTDLIISRFNRTRGGYRHADDLCLGSGDTATANLETIIQVFANAQGRNQPSALSLSAWDKGKAMSGDSWRYADGLLLEYMAGPEDQLAERCGEIVLAANALGYRYWLLDTCTRKGERTYTVIWQFDDRVDSKQYARLASVMAERMGVYRAASGVIAHTHLVHLHPQSAVAYHEGLTINPRMLIHQTARLYQNMNPKRFEGNAPRSRAVEVQVARPAIPSKAAETTFDELFSF